MSRRIHAKAKCLAQPIELLAPCLRSDCVGGQSIGADTELTANEMKSRLRESFARPQQPTGIAECAQLQGIAELVMATAAAPDCG